MDQPTSVARHHSSSIAAYESGSNVARSAIVVANGRRGGPDGNGGASHAGVLAPLARRARATADRSRPRTYTASNMSQARCNTSRSYVRGCCRANAQNASPCRLPHGSRREWSSASNSSKRMLQSTSGAAYDAPQSSQLPILPDVVGHPQRIRVLLRGRVDRAL